MRSTILALAIAASACGNDTSGGSARGTASVAGKPAKITGCQRVRSDFGSRQEISLDTGHVLWWDIPDTMVRKDGQEQAVECGNTDMSELNGKGTWKTTCAHPDGEIVLDVEFDCR